jgi:integrase
MTSSNDRRTPRRQALARVFPGLDSRTAQALVPSLDFYCRAAETYLTWCRGARGRALDPATLCAWQTHLVHATTLSPHTINTYVRSIVRLVDTCAALGTLPPTLAQDFARVDRLPVTHLPHRLTPTSRLTYTPAQIRQLCLAPDHRTLLGLRDRALLLTLASSGLKSHDVVTLTPADLIARGTGWGLRVRRRREPDRARLAPVSRESVKWIRRWVGTRDQDRPAPWIFTSQRGGRMSPSAVWQTVQVYGRQIGLPHLTPQALRRFVAQQVTQQYGLQQARKVLGHATGRTPGQHWRLDGPDELITEKLF